MCAQICAFQTNPLLNELALHDEEDVAEDSSGNVDHPDVFYCSSHSGNCYTSVIVQIEMSSSDVKLFCRTVNRPRVAILLQRLRLGDLQQLQRHRTPRPSDHPTGKCRHGTPPDPAPNRTAHQSTGTPPILSIPMN